MKINTPLLLKSIIGLAVVAAALILVQMWFEIFDGLVFFKMLMTLLILGGIASFIIAVVTDMDEEKRLRDDKFID